MTPAYIKDQLERSRRNLGLETIDVYYIHNPETQLSAVSREEFKSRIEKAFRVLEDAVKEGQISVYGVATWNGFRVSPENPGHLSLSDLVTAAQAAGGDGHHFRVVQAPYNLQLQELAEKDTEVVQGKRMPLSNAAKELGVLVIASGSEVQAKLAQGLPPLLKEFFKALGDKPTDAQCAVLFVRMTPGIMTALSGMRQVSHLEENAGINHSLVFAEEVMVTRVLSPPPQLMPGQANIVGTDSYIRLFPAPNSGAEYFRSICTKVPNVGDLLVSSLGIGTGNGLETDECDTEYRRAITRALDLGINIIDTSISYRSMRSERAVGWALARAVAERRIERAQVVVCTKGGYLTFECDRPAYNLNPKQWIDNTYFKRGIITTWGDIVYNQNCMPHCIAPKFIRNQVERSRKNLGLETIDVYYLQNPEVHLLAMSRDEFNERMVNAFKTLEELSAERKICVYGISSWNGFRVPIESQGYLSLEDCVYAAHAAGGDDHHFRVVQVPFNLQMREASELPAQEVRGERMSLLGAADMFDLQVIACGTLQQQKLTSYCGDIIRDQRLPVQVLHCIADLGDQATDAQCALQFARTTPGIVTAIAGMRSHFHVEENAEIVKRLASYQYHPELNTEPFQWRLGD